LSSASPPSVLCNDLMLTQLDCRVNPGNADGVCVGVIIPFGDEGTMVVVVGALDEMLLGADIGLDGLTSARGGADVSTGAVADAG
jgi:hypothetical protein